MRVFKNKWFNKWARKEGVPDAVLFEVAEEVADGRAEADLGGYLFKKRVPRPGAGKRGGYRTIVGYKQTGVDRVIFLYAFAKSDKANITSKEEAALSIAAGAFLSASDSQIDRLLEQGMVLEIER